MATIANTNSRSDFREKNLRQWSETLSALFPDGVPEHARWVSLREIVNVLSKIAHVKDLAHGFYPDGGGMDLSGARLSHEPECIELDFDGAPSIIKPKVMTFECVQNDLDWAYFRIECDALNPSGVYNQYRSHFEELVEIAPRQYVPRVHWDEGNLGEDENGDEIPLPRSARLVLRHFSGSFVIFAKGSTYNRNTSTYDGRHSQMSDAEFKEHIRGAKRYVDSNRKKTS